MTEQTTTAVQTMQTSPPVTDSATDCRASGFSREVLRLDAQAEIERIVKMIRVALRTRLRRQGVVLGLSGGIDSTVTAALCVKAVGPKRVLGLLMPERDSSDDSLALGQLVGDWLGIETVVEDVTPLLEGAGCYRRQDEAVRSVVPDYTPGCRFKLVLPPLLKTKGFRLFYVVVRFPDGREVKRRLPFEAYQTIVAATNFKQRCRKMLEYFHADRLNYAVAGTPNRLEYDQGFFVKNGDGAADLKPIAHLYKTQVYQLADALGVPDVIRLRPPTTDTYSLEQSQEEFFFAVPLEVLDLCLYAKNHGVPAEQVAPVVGLTVEQVEQVFQDIDAKRRTTRYLHLPPLLVEPVLSDLPSQ